MKLVIAYQAIALTFWSKQSKLLANANDQFQKGLPRN